MKGGQHQEHFHLGQSSMKLLQLHSDYGQRQQLKGEREDQWKVVGCTMQKVFTMVYTNGIHGKVRHRMGRVITRLRELTEGERFSKSR